MGDSGYSSLLGRARQWFGRCRADGFLDAADCARLERVEARTPADLFADAAGRPLVVALMGGTGVGKSSLLNRLAGSPIARTGVERPTSTELTLYVHGSVKLSALPPELPVEDVRTQRHANDARRAVAWIDAPDIDSTRAHNRDCVLAWLPHIDLVVYVVSPERYRDDPGWRLLLRRRGRHGWLFVMNRWDEGHADQPADFAALLRRAGFDQPLVFCTCCAAEHARAALEHGTRPAQRALPSADQFDQIEQTIVAVVERHGVRELTRLGHRARLLELREAVTASAARLGDEAAWRESTADWDASWRHAREAIRGGMQWPLAVAAQRLAARGAPPAALPRSVASRALAIGVRAAAELARGGEPGGAPAPQSKPDATADREVDALPTAELDYLTRAIWDDWAQGKLGACFDRFEIALGRRNLATLPARQALDLLGEAAGPRVVETVQDCVRAVMAEPVGRMRRVARRVTGFLTAGLPALALGAVAYTLVTSYFRAAAGQVDYPGTNFAVSSVLLVLVAWALPFSIDRLLRPSLERLMTRTLSEAFDAALDDLGAVLSAAVSQVAQRARTAADDGAEIATEIAAVALRPPERRDELLDRLLAQAERRGARATPESGAVALRE